jgi:serine acetyltransferase
MHLRQNVTIHTTSIVEPSVQIGAGSQIGPYSIIGLSERSETNSALEIVLEEGTIIGPHCVIYGDVHLGAGVILDPFCRIGPHATIGTRTRLLYGARIHEHVRIGSDCSIQGNCPDRTTFGNHVIHLGRIAHHYFSPFDDWDEPEELGPTLASNIVIGADALLIGPIHIGDNTFIFPRERVSTDLPGDGIFREGRWHHMPHWQTYLRILKKLDWASAHHPFPHTSRL